MTRRSSSLNRPGGLALATALALGIPLWGPGCTRDVVKRDESVKGGPFPTLLASYGSEVIRTERGGGLPLTGDQLARFGLAALKPTTEALAELGFALELDGDRARGLDELGLFRPSNRLATLTGVWTHPEASAYRFDAPTRGSDKQVARALAAADKERPYFASITLLVDEARSLPVERAPMIKVSLRVLDREGNVVLAARTVGEGHASAIAADVSLPNLLLGLDNALDKLSTVQAEPL